MSMARGLFGMPLVADKVAYAAMNAANASVDPMRQAAPSKPTAPVLTPQAMPEFQRRKRSLSDNLGLLADAFRGTNTNSMALMQQDEQDRRLWQEQQKQYAPQHVGNSIVRLNPQTLQFESLYDAPKDAGSEKTQLQRNYEYLQSLDPNLAKSFIQGETNKPQWITADNGDGTKTVVPIYPGMGGNSPQPMAPGAGALPQGYTVRKKGGSTPSASGTFQPSSVMGALIQQESGGRAGVTGPQTPYGRAQGLAQLLPGTAQEMAKKLGVSWRPDLMTGTSRQAADYQRALGEAYFNEGLSKTGNVRDALRYYHGGPNRRMWKEKTNRYADSVLARAGRS